MVAGLGPRFGVESVVVGQNSFSKLAIPFVRMRIWSQIRCRIRGRWSRFVFKVSFSIRKDENLVSRLGPRFGVESVDGGPRFVFRVGYPLRKDENLVADWVRGSVSNPWSVVKIRFRSWLSPP